MRYPRAEQFANTIELPLVACPVTKELYGYVHPVLDQKKAVSLLCGFGLVTSDPAFEVAMDILCERAERCQ